jgi:hypothetical protein
MSIPPEPAADLPVRRPAAVAGTNQILEVNVVKKVARKARMLDHLERDAA